MLPCSSSLSAQIFPPISSTSCRAIESPSPLPPYFLAVDESACAKLAIRRAEHENRGVRGLLAESLDQRAEHRGVRLLGPVAVARFVGSIGQDNQRQVALRHQLFLKDFIPLQDQAGFGTIQADGLTTLDKIAKAGVSGGGDDGPPTVDVTITSLLLDL